MADTIIRIEGLTKDYGHGRGIFDIDLQIGEGECFGCVGTNGSGKTTTIRNIMGFIKPDNGSVTVKGMDAWRMAVEIKKYVSYIPGEIAFPPAATGMAFLKEQARYMGIENMERANSLLKAFKLDAGANLSRMSKGMKQKTAIVAALMGNEEILVMDEPTTGLDPLMREVFIDTINKEKKKGRTIFMSGHIFEEMEELCDRVAFIKEGRIIDLIDMDKLRREHRNTYFIGFENRDEYEAARAALANQGSGEKLRMTGRDDENCQLKLSVEHDKANAFFALLRKYSIKYINEEAYDLESYFGQAYEGGKQNGQQNI